MTYLSIPNGAIGFGGYTDDLINHEVMTWYLQKTYSREDVGIHSTVGQLLQQGHAVQYACYDEYMARCVQLALMLHGYSCGDIASYYDNSYGFSVRCTQL